MSKINQVIYSPGSIGFCGLLTIVLLVLKALGYLDIAWLWVFAPIWIPIGLAIGIILFCIIMAAIGATFVTFTERKRR